MSLIKIKDACLSFSNLNILNQAMLYINKKERICLIGKNGAGKSTLLKIINKQQDLDHGYIIYKKNIKISYLTQKNPNNLNISIYDFICYGLIQHLFKNNTDNENISKNFQLYKKKLNINYIVKIEKIIDKIQLNKDTLLSELSGGLLRKVALSNALVQEPDLLLLDEPTNHLDIITVRWLENFLKKFSGSTLFVSHDRSFIQNICTRIIDLDRGKIISWPGSYENFIELKNKSNEIEIIHKKIFDQNLDKEEKWIRKSIKARCTRNEGRVKKLKILRKTNENYKKIEKIKNIKINETNNHSGKIIFKLEKINCIINNEVIIQDFSSIIQHGDKIGLIGKNGCGKSTLIKIIIGEIKPNQGNIYIGTGLKTAYFDQNRSILNPNKSILENLFYGSEKIVINGKEQHIIGYLKKFLFQPNQINSLVKTLSGGECNRLLLAQLFLKPSNVLILDEPTNDLDLDTLQLLEKIIINYKGTILLVSHDRKFIENTVNKYWTFEKKGYINTDTKPYQIEFQNEKNIKKYKNKQINIIKNKKSKSNITSIKNNQKEIQKILNSIEKIEKYIMQMQNIINQPDFFKKDVQEKKMQLSLLEQNEKKLEKKLIKWENLEKNIKK